VNVAIVGTGYVGLVAGACIADSGRSVRCADPDALRVAALRGGRPPFHEPGLAELVRRAAKEGRLSFTTSTAEAVAGADLALVTVATPAGAAGDADVAAVLAAAAEIARAATGPLVLALKSTAPPGTAERVAALARAASPHPIDVAANPEFLREGRAVSDFLEPDRVVAGGSGRALALLRELYAPFLGDGRPFLAMDPRSAELAKYAANAMLAVRLSLVNELAALCEATGADFDELRRALGADARIGPDYLFAGAGFGGSCLPKDLAALAAIADAARVAPAMLRAAAEVNARQRRLLLDKAERHYGAVAGKRLCVWGLSFKPETDDLREAPALALVAGLHAAGAEVAAYDPVAGAAARAALPPGVRLAGSAWTAAEGADGVFLVTEWNELRGADLARLRGLVRTPVLFDGRNAWDPRRARALGFTYYGVGRPPLP
jgi:UDPglucose 6-dehydrogenase